VVYLVNCADITVHYCALVSVNFSLVGDEAVLENKKVPVIE